MSTDSRQKFRASFLKHELGVFVSLALLAAVSILGASVVHADIVQVTYSIQASDFLDSNNGSPSAPTSNQLGGTVTFTYNTQVLEQNEMVPDQVSGFSMTDNDGNLIQYDQSNSGVNARTYIAAGNDNHRIIYGGTISSVEFMGGISEDFRVTFDISPVDYTVVVVGGPLSFVTTADAFFTAQNTEIELTGLQVTPDNDGDNVSDDTDNCIHVTNTDQRDTNDDNLGNACDPDFNQDCQVNFIDLSVFGNNFLVPGDLDTDLNGDGVTNFVDLSVLTSYIFGAPGPSGLSNSCDP